MEMLHLIYDTETTGLPIDYKAHVHDVDNWPRLVQLAFMVCNDHWETLTTRNYIIKPVGFEISDEVAEIHGVSQERALEEGVDILVPLRELAITQELVDVQVGHNINFDRKVLGAEFIRNDMEEAYDYAKDMLPRICTMFKTTKLVGLKLGNRPKWPKLEELYSFLFNEPLNDAHDAMVDVMATRACYKRLVGTGEICP
jgi:DNA polymerase III epsilon subunit-like protein